VLYGSKNENKKNENQNTALTMTYFLQRIPPPTPTPNYFEAFCDEKNEGKPTKKKNLKFSAGDFRKKCSGSKEKKFFVKFVCYATTMVPFVLIHRCYP
jgi:hypothetical protein